MVFPLRRALAPFAGLSALTLVSACVACVACFACVACGSGTGGSFTTDGGDVAEAGGLDGLDGSTMTASDSGAGLDEDAATDAGETDSAIGTGAGSCLSPQTITLPFTASADATTLGQLDTSSVACGAPANVPELVYRLVLATAASVTVTGKDQSGSGVGVQVRQDTCAGTSVGCDWESNGNINRSFSLPAGTWLFIVERNPAGKIAFSVAP